MISKLAVIGAGQMGSGIAHVAALSGIDVILNDISQERLDKALAAIDRHMARQSQKGRLSDEDREAGLARISATLDLSGISGVDMVIEAATEKEELKRDIFARVCKVLPPEVIIASNTSSIPITRLAASMA